eukprot:125625-Ditylum_brightwellii.AAC.1
MLFFYWKISMISHQNHKSNCPNLQIPLLLGTTSDLAFNYKGDVEKFKDGCKGESDKQEADWVGD